MIVSKLLKTLFSNFINYDMFIKRVIPHIEDKYNVQKNLQ
jgi:hypothetical protein